MGRNLVRRMRGLSLMVAAACVAWPLQALGQGLQRPPSFHGLAVGAELTWGSSWSFTEQIPGIGAEAQDIPASRGLGATSAPTKRRWTARLGSTRYPSVSARE
jgi:hypothetical protein